MAFIPIEARLQGIRRLKLPIPLYQKYAKAMWYYMRDRDEIAERLVREIEREYRHLSSHSASHSA